MHNFNINLSHLKARLTKNRDGDPVPVFLFYQLFFRPFSISTKVDASWSPVSFAHLPV